MNVYIWREVANLTDSHHNYGGVVVAAQTLDAARDIIRTSVKCTSDWHYEPDDHMSSCGPRTDCEALTKDPDYIYPTTDDQRTELIVFPNKGCC